MQHFKMSSGHDSTVLLLTPYFFREHAFDVRRDLENGTPTSPLKDH